jgi:hypothetical protein
VRASTGLTDWEQDGGLKIDGWTVIAVARDAVIVYRGALSTSSAVCRSVNGHPHRPTHFPQADRASRSGERVSPGFGGRAEAARRPLQRPRARTELRRTLRSEMDFTRTWTCALASRIFSRRHSSARRVSNLSSRMDRQFRLIRVDHEHREELGRLRLAGICAGWRSPGNSEKLCPAS